MVCGLPLDSADFALLPPHFPVASTEPGEDTVIDPVNDALEKCFARPLRDRANLVPILRMCLASVVYHIDWIRQQIPPSSILYQTLLFSDAKIISQLSPLVVCSRSKSGDLIATGVPAHVTQIAKLDVLEKRITAMQKCLVERSSTIVVEILDGMDQLLDKKSFEQGNITAGTLKGCMVENFKGMLYTALDECGVLPRGGRAGDDTQSNLWTTCKVFSCRR